APELGVDDLFADVRLVDASGFQRRSRQGLFGHQQGEAAGVDLNRAEIDVESRLVNAKVGRDFDQTASAEAEATGGRIVGKALSGKLGDDGAATRFVEALRFTGVGVVATDDGLVVGEADGGAGEKELATELLERE